MSRGPHLTPDELGEAAKVYVREGSFALAAEAIHRDESTVRKALRRLGYPDLSSLHRARVEDNLRRGRASLNRTRKKLDAKIASATLGELVAIAKGLSLTVGRLTALGELELRRRQAALTRRKTKAEIAALEKGVTLNPEQLLGYLAALPREELVALIAQLKANRGAAPTTPATPAPSTDAPPTGAT